MGVQVNQKLNLSKQSSIDDLPLSQLDMARYFRPVANSTLKSVELKP